MTASHATLAHISDLVHTEIAGYLSQAFVIAEVTSEFLPGPDGDDYIRTTVILEDGPSRTRRTRSQQILSAHRPAVRRTRL